MQELATIIRERGQVIIDAWQVMARELPRTKPLTEPVMVDRIADVLAWIAAMTEGGAATSAPTVESVRRAIVELSERFDALEVMRELHALRQCILSACAADLAGVGLDEHRRMHAAIDDAIASTVVRCNELRERGLNRDAQHAIRIREDVLALVSHDLRSPLAAIDLGATLLAQLVDERSPAQRAVSSIRNAARRMARLIDDLLDIASIKAGKLAIVPIDVDAGELVAEMFDTHAPIASERGITFDRECDVAGVVVRIDRARMAQVFGNLLGNSLKFCSDGDAILVRGARDDGCVRFVVADTGPGIPQTELPHIFEPYWSGHSGKKGTGLGLFISKAIVEAHGGRIEVTSVEGRGTSFVVTLPLAER